MIDDPLTIYNMSLYVWVIDIFHFVVYCPRYIAPIVVSYVTAKHQKTPYFIVPRWVTLYDVVFICKLPAIK
jgi:hypothetical protein